MKFRECRFSVVHVFRRDGSANENPFSVIGWTHQFAGPIEFRILFDVVLIAVISRIGYWWCIPKTPTSSRTRTVFF
jgi:hypothetical protein